MTLTQAIIVGAIILLDHISFCYLRKKFEILEEKIKRQGMEITELRYRK